MRTGFIYMVILAFGILICSAQPYVSDVWVSDLGDGTYRNPVLHADYSDPDVIRVGDDYYMTASSFSCVPGLPILHSRDLVNWKLVNYALKNLYLEGVEPIDFFNKPQHGKGVWAPCLRYHNNEFMIYWGDPDFGIYVVKTRNVLGRWDEPVLVMPGKGRIDPSPLFDDDGKVYLVHAWAGSRANLNSIMTLCELNADGTKVIGEEVLIYDGNDGVNHTVEGGKFYKKDGYYYMLAPAGGVATGWQLAFRSKNINGPYEVKKVLAQGRTAINGPHQGGLVQTQTGEWWFLHFQDKGVFGRVVHLQPVNWKNGWPVMGTKEKNGCGEPVLVWKKPDIGKEPIPQVTSSGINPSEPVLVNAYPVETPAESDEFNMPGLGRQWQWHANPLQTYGFTTPSGYLRLYGQYYPESFANFWDIPNLLLQKFPTPAFTATTRLSAVLRNDGDKTGLIVMGWDYGYLALVKTAGGYALEYRTCADAEQKTEETLVSLTTLKNIRINEKNNHTSPIPDVEIYLRVKVSEDGYCTFGYSTDGKKFQDLSAPFRARQGKWIGAKTGLFILNAHEKTQRSWVDADWFRITRNTDDKERE